MVKFDDGYDPFPDEPVSDADLAVMGEVTDLEARLVQALDREQVLRHLIGDLHDVLFDVPFHSYCEWRTRQDRATSARLDVWMARRDKLFLEADKERL